MARVIFVGLQWSRRLSATETEEPVGVAGDGVVASMEPSPLSDGNPPAASASARARPGFNGAVASQRRKPGR